MFFDFWLYGISFLAGAIAAWMLTAESYEEKLEELNKKIAWYSKRCYWHYEDEEEVR